MKCPWCDNEMEKGYLQSTRKIFYTQEVKEFFVYPEKGDIVLTTNNWIGPNVKVACCKMCNKIVIDYNDK